MSTEIKAHKVQVNHSPLFVRKEDGSKEAFDQKKLYESLIKSGAEPHQADKIVREVIGEMRQKMSDTKARAHEHKTDHMAGHIDGHENSHGKYIHEEFLFTAADIYHEAYTILKRSARVVAARYSLRRSMLQFGPTGFPFEAYVAEVFKAKWGYQAITGQIVLGGCVPHEVDVVAWNKEKLIMAEVKYHSDAASKTDTKVSLYVRARFDDLAGTTFNYGGIERKLTEGWLITNTRFTDTAIIYGHCKGLKMLSWDYPEKDNLQDLIEGTQLHPITCLTSLSDGEKRILMDKDIVLARSLYTKRPILREMGFSEKRIEGLLDEVDEIMKTIPMG
jgi:hypothetical protein